VKADIAVIGLAVMGQNLILNMDDHGFRVIAYNRSPEKTREFLSGSASGTNIQAAFSLKELVEGLERPRKILFMVKAGEAVDQLIDQLVPLLSPGDVLIDGGNSNFTDTSRRVESLATKDIFFLGCGISGGEEGARHGPSIMPGGNHSAWASVKPILQSISAKTKNGDPCCNWVGEGGAGHFVKMVHNGIEYGDMQLISEAYHFMQTCLGMTNEEMHEVFTEWNKTELDSYLIKITAEILNTKDTDGSYVLDKILDAAGQKGTGKWTSIHSLNLGIPLNLITESVFARCISALKQQRILAASVFNRGEIPVIGDKEEWLHALRLSLLASKIMSYAQGFMLMREASAEYAWKLSFANVALLWRGGCIIQSGFLQNIADAFTKDPELTFLGLDDFFKALLEEALPNWRKLACKSIELGLPMPCTLSALTFLDAYSTARLPANMIQAQRDYFGAHTFERIDKPKGEFFHHEWISK
jgi:6-phosphogluconate dehydrogenase